MKNNTLALQTHRVHKYVSSSSNIFLLLCMQNIIFAVETDRCDGRDLDGRLKIETCVDGIVKNRTVASYHGFIFKHIQSAI